LLAGWGSGVVVQMVQLGREGSVVSLVQLGHFAKKFSEVCGTTFQRKFGSKFQKFKKCAWKHGSKKVWFKVSKISKVSAGELAKQPQAPAPVNGVGGVMHLSYPAPMTLASMTSASNISASVCHTLTR